ncbi:sodium-dependent bicarbonate transport family permease [Tepidimonas charontis]|uniref:Na+-dependent bicarbonate transporter superfamily protein n=1 Tax=Tepidimonas charontis TaxID=2267262 RepID=A0A554XID6_9BURK|nr:sodium-dependent bicarbonate transport family permease [Tepidimonas charontis]TSE35597.1 Na+-dependent bicarbonate transporter superfamily protein [Tepidimonas charontis]
MSSLDPVILFFLLGLVAGLLRSELKLPGALYDSLSIFLLLAIGLKGGQGLATQPLAPLLPQVAAAVALGVVQTLLAFGALRWLFGFDRPDAAATAAHYGSVSVATYAVATAWLAARAIDVEPQMAVLLAVMEVPAILVGIMLARGIDRRTDWAALSHEAFLGKGVTLLLGGMAIGWAAGPDGLQPISPLFVDLFKGVLALFLLEMGLIVSRQVGELRRRGLALVVFGVAMPLLSAPLGAATGVALGLSVGGTTVLATLAASASYIAVPAAMRIAVPQANPALSLAGALGVTFPFNLLVGIPLYHRLAVALVGS